MSLDPGAILAAEVTLGAAAWAATITAVGAILGALLKDSRRNTQGAWKLADEREKETKRQVESAVAGERAVLMEVRARLAAMEQDRDYWRNRALKQDDENGAPTA